MSRPSSNPVDAYAGAVVSGAVPAGKYHRLSCARHLNDRRREDTPGFPYRFDLPRAERFFRFASKLKHYKGEWAGQPIVLRPYQQFRLGSLFGWVHAGTGLRRFKNAYNELPRKNGKSLEAAVVALYVTFYDGEPGAEGYCAATKRDQASIVFNDCKALVQSSGLKTRIKVQVNNLHREDTASKLEPLGADHDSTDGLNPNLVTLDELHAYKTRGLIDVLETATGARRQPVINKITTAGDDPVSPGGDEHDYACQVLEGALIDETYFAFIAHADPQDDWTSPATAKKANPNYGVSVNPEDLAGKVVKAQGMPSAAATYKQKHLNLWVNASAPCLSVDGWRRGQSHLTRHAFEASLEGQRCYAAIDLASKLDLMSLSLAFPPTDERSKWAVIQRIWTPRATMDDRARRDRVPYAVWEEQGWLTTLPGVQMDHMVCVPELRALRARFAIELVGLDPWHSDQVIGALKKEPWVTDPDETILEVSQSFPGMSKACLTVQAEIEDANIDANSCPVTGWAVSNVVDGRDSNDNMKFVKKKSRGRIDPVVSIAIAFALWLKRPDIVEPDYEIHFFGGRA
jgi:phage terminase large subunit-like protein